MAEGTQVGTAWIAITPSFQGFASNITSALTGELTQAGQRAGEGAGDAAGESFASRFHGRVSGLADQLSGVGGVAGAVTAGAFAAGLTTAMDASGANAKLSAQLGLTADEADRVGRVAGDVFTAGFGDSIESVNGALQSVHTNIGSLGGFTDAELTSMTTDVLALAETFDQDLGGVTTAVGQLMKTGLAADAQEAFDVLTAGFQSGADRSGDLLDTITEYSTQFRKAGLDGATAVGLMNQAIQGGARDADVAADAIKEFSIRAVDGSAATAQGFQALGLNADDMAAKFGAGGKSAKEALDATLDRLRAIKDPVKQSQAAVALFGTQAEDLGKALFALDPSTATLENVSGAAGDLGKQLTGDPGRQFSASIRQLTTTLGDALLPILQRVANFASKHPTLFKAVAFTVLGAAAAFTVLTATLWALNLALAANPVTWIVLAVIAGVAALAALVALIVVHWNQIVAATQTALDWLLSTLTAAWNTVVAAAQVAWSWLGQIVSQAWQALVGFIRSINPAGTITGYWNQIRSATTAAWNRVLATIRAAWTAITSAAVGAAARLWSLIVGAWNRVRSATSSAWSTIKNAISSALTRAYNAVRDIGGRFVSIGRDIVRGIVNGVRNAGSALYSALRGLAAGALKSAKNFLGIGSPSRLFADQVGQWIPAGVELGIDRGQGDLTRRLEHLVQVPDMPTVRATVASGPAAAPAPVVIRADGNRASRVLVELLQHAVRTDLGGDVNRLAGAR